MKPYRLNVKLLVITALLSAAAAALSWLEGLIPIQLLVPLPGLKFGLANIVTMFAIFFLGTKPAFAVVIVRSTLGAFLGGGPVALAYSMTGAMLAAVAMMVLKRGYDKAFSLYGISMGGAAAFNIGQVMVAAFMLQDIAIFTYLPVLMAGGTVTGILTAAIATPFFHRMDKSRMVERFLRR